MPWSRGCRRRPGRRSPARPRGSRCSRWRRSAPLIDRDIVRPVEGVYRLTGDVGELAVPDSLHALLAARLDALDPGVRRLVADAAVLGTTFPAEALIAVSGQDETAVRAALAELVRREVFTVSADPLSPERGSYGFAQNMLRQVAYDTLSRRDRKTRHLKVAAHLRAAFPGDGEEVAEVIARHYLDALEAVPGDPDAAEIRGQAIGALIRAAERAERTGRPRPRRGQLRRGRGTDPDRPAGRSRSRSRSAVRRHPVGTRRRGRRHQRRLGLGRRAGGPGPRLPPAGRPGPGGGPGPGHRRAGAAPVGPPRRGARAAHRRPRGAAGRSRHRHGARPGSAGVGGGVRRVARRGPAVGRGAVPRPGPRRRRRRAQPTCSKAAGSTSTALTGAAEAAAYFRESARLADQAGDSRRLGLALLNLADNLAVTDPAAAAETARTAAGHLRRVGDRDALAYAIGNLAQALLMLGDWDAAEAELTQAADSDGLADYEFLACYRGWLAALRGDAAAAQAMLAGLTDLRASEDPQEQALISLVEAFTAAARRQPQAALRPRPRHPRSRRRPRDQPRDPALGVAAGRPRRP